MYDWSDPNVIKRYQAAQIAYKRYRRLAEKTDYKRYISFDMAKKRMFIVPVDSDNEAESYPIGKLLLDFANLDLTDYQREWEHVRHILDYPEQYIEYAYFNRGTPPLNLWRDDAERSKALCLDRLVKDHQHLHPYFLVYDSTYMTLKRYDYFDRMDEELDIFDVQDEVKKCINLYLDEQIDAPYAHLSATQRYLLHHQTAARAPFFTNKSTVFARIPRQPIVPKEALTPTETDEPEDHVSGGYVTASGTVDEVLKSKRSLTAAYLNGDKQIPVPSVRRKGNGKFLELKNVKTHNLKGINFKLPLGTLTCITGVSGSGKSSLVLETLFPALNKVLNGSRKPAGKYTSIKGAENIDKIIDIDQSPIGRTPRSNPAT